MNLGNAERLFKTLKSINLDHLIQNPVGEGTIFFKGVLYEGRGICGVYMQNTGCCIYVQHKESDPPERIPTVILVQSTLNTFFEADSKKNPPDFDDVKRTLGPAYYSMFWGTIM